MQPSNKKKQLVSVRDKLDGNEIDLSHLELSEVPVKELAAVPRGTRLDLSNTKIVTLPASFPTLIHLVKLDLSKNQLKELPVHFGDLTNLKHLDLYSNQLVRLPVSFYQLKELRWLDLKNNPLVATLQEAAGDCLDDKGCQDAAKKVVKLMTVVNTELEKKRLKDQEELKAQQMAQKSEEDRARDRAKNEKKVEKEKRRLEAEAAREASINTNHRNGNGQTVTNVGHSVPTVKQNNKAEKKAQRQRQARIESERVEGPSCLGTLFVILMRLLFIGMMLASIVFVINWQGPLAMDNATVVAKRSVNQVVDYTNQIYDWLSPHLDPVRKQWCLTSRYVAENGRDLVFIGWDKTKHYAEIVKQQVVVTWPLVRQRVVEVSSLTGNVLSEYSAIICKEAPVYYEAAVTKVTQLYQSVTAAASQTKKD